MKVAFIGTGNIFETVHFPNFSKYNSECEITAIVDNNENRAKHISLKYNVPNCYTSIDDVLEKSKPNIVVICLPNKFHHEAVMKSLASGANVLCEKPPGLNSSEAKEMTELAKSNNLVLAYNFHYRHSENVSFLKKQIDKGRLGNIYNVKVQALRRRGIPGWGSFINKDIQGGGSLIDIGIHMLDTALYLTGYPKLKSIMASTYKEIGTRKSKGTLGNWNPEQFGVEDSAFAFVKFEGGITLNLETSFALNIKEKSIMNTWVYGNEAGASTFPLEIYGDCDGELLDEVYPFLDERGNHEASIRRFLDNCIGQQAMIATGDEGYMIQKIIDGIYQSAELGDVIKYE